MFSDCLRDLKKEADGEKAAFFPRFFKTGKGEYGEGDVFIGVTVPHMRLIAKKYVMMTEDDIAKLLKSPIHECRLTGLLILVRRYEKANKKDKKKIVMFYVKHIDRVNNWDLVDSSASYILGAELFGGDTKILDRFAKSRDLWKQRIAIIATHYFIRRNKFDDTFRIAKILLNHPHDLIHKAVGWMLREVGNRDRKAEEEFLRTRYKIMPRTMLRYAIEKFPESKRKAYLYGKI